MSRRLSAALGAGPTCVVTDRPFLVECHAGHRGEEAPRRFRQAGRWVGVVDVVNRWMTPDHRCFIVTGNDGGTYVLRHNVMADTWELLEGSP